MAACASFPLPNQFISPRVSTTRLAQPRNIQFRVSAAAASTSNSLYEVLGIQMSATFQEIKTAYRRLARITHPDVASSSATATPAGADEFIRVYAAYSTLSDPEKRADYDRKLSWGTRPLFYNYTSPSRNWETDQCW